MDHKELTDVPAESLCKLTAFERLLVWSFRHRVFGGVHWQRASKEMQANLPIPKIKELVDALDQLVVIACTRARRMLHFHRLDCHGLSASELCLLTIVAACQQHKAPLACATSRWLVQDTSIGSLLEHAQAVADTFASQGWRLPLRQVRGPEAHREDNERSLRRVLH
jgi:hypothetical protein